MEIYTLIRELRKIKGISQKELANNIGLSQQAIALIENGKRKIDTDLFFKIIVYLKPELFEQINYDTNIDTNHVEYLIHRFCSTVLEATSNHNLLDKSQSLIKLFNTLNEVGKQKAIEQLEMLTKIPEYLTLSEIPKDLTSKTKLTYIPEYKQNHTTLNVAHARTDIEIPYVLDTSDDDIMDDENF